MPGGVTRPSAPSSPRSATRRDPPPSSRCRSRSRSSPIGSSARRSRTPCARPRPAPRAHSLPSSRRLELDSHDAARAFILSELARETGARVSFTGKTLGLLKDAELPEVEPALLFRACRRSSTTARRSSCGRRCLRGTRRRRSSTESGRSIAPRRTSTSACSPISGVTTQRAPRSRCARSKTSTRSDGSPITCGAPFSRLVVQRLKTRDASTAARLLAERGSASAETALVDRWREVHASGADPDGLGQDLQDRARSRSRLDGDAGATPHAARALRRCDVQDRSRIDGRPILRNARVGA